MIDRTKLALLIAGLMLAASGCSVTGREIFPEGKAPREPCPMHSGLDSPFEELRDSPAPDDYVPEKEPEPTIESEIDEGVELYKPGMN